MNPETGYSKKDKRLLVLLAFGACIMLLNINLLPGSDNPPIRFYWLEFPGKDIPVVYRSTDMDQIDSFSAAPGRKLTAFPDNNKRSELRKKIAEEKAAAVFITDNSVTLNPVSPRLAFFLGQPLAINKASLDELVLIPGIGPVLAKKIIDYRQKNGSFDNKQALTSVPGIGPKTASRISSFFSFE